MRAQPLTYLLLVLSALFVAFGALLDLWFYAVAGVVLALYLIWRFLAFQSVIGSLQLQIRRNVDKTVARRGGRVNVEVFVSSRVPVEGLFSDTLPKGVDIVDGTNRAWLSLRAGEPFVLRYALVTTSRETVSIENSSFTLNNGLFAHTIQYSAATRGEAAAICRQRRRRCRRCRGDSGGTWCHEHVRAGIISGASSARGNGAGVHPPL